MLLPTDLHAEHFRTGSIDDETGDLGYWLNQFFGMRHEDIVEACYKRAEDAVQQALGQAVLTTDMRGHIEWDFTQAQLELSAHQLAEIWWHDVLQLSTE